MGNRAASLVGRRSHLKHQKRIEKQRSKVYKLSVKKLRNIYDPEVLLCKSVLINNTLHDLRRRKAAESVLMYVEDILSQAVAPPPIIEDIEDFIDEQHDISKPSDLLGDASLHGPDLQKQEEDNKDDTF